MPDSNRSADLFDKPLASPFLRAVHATPVRPYYRPLHARDGEAVMDGRQVVMAGCNDYLGLATDPRVTAAAGAALRTYGASCSGARTLNGTLPLHGELEAAVADFLGTEDAAVVTTGFQSNLALAALFGAGDVVLSDNANHASLIDGIRLGAAHRLRYRHRDPVHLERLLTDADPAAAKAVVTDGMFSMDGALAPLPALTAAARRHGARTIVDGAHDIGLLGPAGRGAAEHFGVHDRVDLFTGTFSKCFGSTGGFLAGPTRVITYLRYAARAILFSASMPPPALAAAMSALEISIAEPWRRHRVLTLAARLRERLSGLGYDTGSAAVLGESDAGPAGPVIAVRAGDAAACVGLWQRLLDEGVYTNPVGPPAVPEGCCIIRVTLQATHTDTHVDRIADAFAAARRLTPAPAVPVLARPRQAPAPETAR
ncbi:aminotransferase class I/II-fold pyridoxal phosphate-dependent enzyme [Streptomyces hiroshimensis]|uniref:8-amino-7-oxononanoate synthase n=1 Tax=Streptomyces hiroshimensis TaxID=66424 RepID=A0ABQ2YJM5_9ACTN|nr:aminotransferase class I/II-fold pyridoxal phosphate-dependent enzyme [Streptomyces hiroshimensis]GGX86430.1 2-amino-3-ketobutyrate CoA ligase [Streptomyces hiroshimensis]